MLCLDCVYRLVVSFKIYIFVFGIRFFEKREVVDLFSGSGFFRRRVFRWEDDYFINMLSIFYVFELCCALEVERS